MVLRVGIPDLISPSYFPLIAAVELGYVEREGCKAEVELVFPVVDTFARLRDGALDYVGGAAHAALYAFPEWRGARLLCALSQNMYWFLVVRADLAAGRGDLHALAGLSIGAAPGPVDGLRRMLQAVGVDDRRDLEIVPVPSSPDSGNSFGVTAAAALERGELDGFWANGMGAEVAVRRGVGRVILDARRGDGPPGASNYTFPALVATEQRVAERPDEVAGIIRATVAAQRALRATSSLATEAVRDVFPSYETTLIADLIERDAPFYDPDISVAQITATNEFARDLGLLTHDVDFERVVATQFGEEWWT